MQRQTLFTLLLSIFISLLGIGIIVPVMPVYAKSLGASGFALGMIIATFSISRGVLQPYIGSVSDTFGRKRFLIIGLFIYAIVGLLIPEATSVNHLITIRFLHGIGSAMIVPVAMAYVSNLAPVGHEGRYMSYLNISIFTGMGCGPIIGGVIYDWLGFRAVFYLMALMSLMACLLIIRTLSPAEKIASKNQVKLFVSMGMMLKNRRTLGILIVRYATMIVMVPSMAFLPLLMQNSHNSNGTMIGMVIACRTFVNAALQIPCGRMADKRNKIMLLLCGVSVMVVAITYIPLAPTIPSLLITYCLLGSGEAIIWPVLGAYASQEGREKYGHGTMMGVFNWAMSCGVLTGAILAGYSMDTLGIQWSFFMPAIAIGSFTSLGIFLIHTGSKPQPTMLLTS